MNPRIFVALSALLIGIQGGSAIAANHVVTQKGKKFSPSVLDIKAGDTITFTNDDKHRHNVYSRTQGHKFRIKKQKPGESNQITLADPGTIEVRCAMHPKMKMKVHVLN